MPYAEEGQSISEASTICLSPTPSSPPSSPIPGPRPSTPATRLPMQDSGYMNGQSPKRILKAPRRFSRPSTAPPAAGGSDYDMAEAPHRPGHLDGARDHPFLGVPATRTDASADRAYLATQQDTQQLEDSGVEDTDDEDMEGLVTALLQQFADTFPDGRRAVYVHGMPERNDGWTGGWCGGSGWPARPSAPLPENHGDDEDYEMKD